MAFNFVPSRSRSWALVSALGTASTGTAFERNIEPLATAPFPTAEYGDWIVTAFKAGKPLIVDDMVTDVRFDESQRAAHLGLGIQAEAALPLLSNGNLVAMLVVHSAAPRAWSERDPNVTRGCRAYLGRGEASASQHLARRQAGRGVQGVTTLRIEVYGSIPRPRIGAMVAACELGDAGSCSLAERGRKGSAVLQVADVRFSPT